MSSPDYTLVDILLTLVLGFLLGIIVENRRP